MIISKAIEILELECTSQKLKSDPDYLASSKLSIEALKRIEQGRLHPFNPMYIPLPGESMPERGIQAGLPSSRKKKTKRASRNLEAGSFL